MGFFDNKTEPATPKKRDEARKKGQVARSTEVVSVAVLMLGFVAIRAVTPEAIMRLREDMEFYLSVAAGQGRTDVLSAVPLKMVITLGQILLPIMAAVMVASLVANVAQTGPMLIQEPLKVDLKKIDPLQGMKRILSPNSLAELAKAILKVALVGWVLYTWLLDRYEEILTMAVMDLGSAVSFSGQSITNLIWRALSALVVIAVVDFAYQKYSFENNLKMSKDELKDEWKQAEGSPEIKAAIKRKQREMAMGRMMAAVPTADVVVTNPTHYAVALKYDPETMQAPEIVALGQRLVALKIRDLAKENGVPVVENPPLARALFAACEVGDAVPGELYAAVAEVLAYVYRLSGKALPTRSVERSR